MRRSCLILSSLLSLALLPVSPVFSQDTQEILEIKDAPLISSHEKAAIELYRLTGGSDSAEAGADAMLEAMTKHNPELEEYRDVFRSWYKKVFAGDEFELEMAGLYTKFFTEEELRELIAFYKTPLGLKTSRTLPEIMRQATELGAGRAEARSQELVDMLMEAMAKKGKKPADGK